MASIPILASHQIPNVACPSAKMLQHFQKSLLLEQHQSVYFLECDLSAAHAFVESQPLSLQCRIGFSVHKIRNRKTQGFAKIPHSSNCASRSDHDLTFRFVIYRAQRSAHTFRSVRKPERLAHTFVSFHCKSEKPHSSRKLLQNTSV